MKPHPSAGVTPGVSFSAADARSSCDEEVARTARPLLLVTSGLLAAFTLATVFVTPYPENVPIAAAQAMLGSFFFVAGRSLRPGARAIRFVHPIFAALTLGALGSVLITYAETGSGLLTSGVVILIAGAGVITLSWPWLIIILSIYTVGWIGGLLIMGAPPLWSQLVFTIVASDMLAIMAHAARYKTHLRLEILRRQDVKQREDLEAGLQALRETEARLRSVVRAAPVVLLATDTAGVVTVAEGSGLMARGWDKVPLVGKPARELLNVVPEERARLERALAGEASSGMTERDGRVFETIWTPTYTPNEEIDGAICVATDVTDRVHADAEARRAAARESDIAKLKEMDRFKTRILNTASHELNTPLTPIKLQMHLLKASLSQTDAKQLKAVNVLERNVDRLASLVSDIMDVARLQEGELRLAPTRVRLDELAREAGGSYEAVAGARNITLHVKADGPLPLDADPKRILQVLFNLLGNALKFTPEGGTVEVIARNVDGHLEIAVRDNGPGMTEEQISRLFQPFSQVHDMARTSYGGTGLGLYISRGIAKQHGGELICQSDGPGKGTQLTLILPAPTLEAHTRS